MPTECLTIDQALVTVGGKGLKLREGGVSFPLSKSFIEVEGKPLFYWCLRELLRAQIKRLVLVAETQEKLQRAEKVVDDATAGHNLEEVVLFQDKGYGTSGLPYQARDSLDTEFVFECGHNIAKSSHYDEIKRVKNPDVVVYSGFKPSSYSGRTIVNVDLQTGIAQEEASSNTRLLAVTTPLVLDQAYVYTIPSYNFNFLETVRAQVKKQAAVVVFSSLPIEVDVSMELEAALPIYRQLIHRPYPGS